MKIVKLCPNLFAIVFIWSCSVFSNQYEINGLVKTKEFVIQTEIENCRCDDPELLKQQLLRTGLFYSVEIQQIDASRFKINLQEKWTTIPILKFNSGGGTTQTTVGVYDPHLLGQRIELGFQYEQLQNAPSFVFWNRIPRFLESRFFTDLQYWDTKRIRLKYNPNIDKPVLIKAFLLESEKKYLAIGYQLDVEQKIQVVLESQIDRFSTHFLKQETLNEVSGQVLPLDTEVNLYGVQYDYGLLKQELGLQVGTLFSAQLKTGVPKSEDRFHSLKIDLNHYSLIHQDWLFAQRLRLGTTDANILQFWNYLGGLESIRGFADNRFATKNYWLSNSEIRKYIFEKPSWILQSVTFADLIGIDEGSKNIENINAASVGVGLRLIMPKIYRLVIRFDYAKPVINVDSENISFGIQQFF